MYKIPFFKFSPGGNMTLLFEGLHYSVAQQQRIAAESLCAQHLGGEQAGFIDRAKGQLRMAGGEFCLNAARALGLVMALDAGLDTTQSLAGECPVWQGNASVSGLEESLALCVRRHTQETEKKNGQTDVYTVAATLPSIHIPPMEHLAHGVVCVRVPGITHLLIDMSQYAFSHQRWRQEATAWRRRYDLEDKDAVGCIWWSQKTEPSFSSFPPLSLENTATDTPLVFEAHPVVAVKNPPTECYERACGSGSLALALMQYSLHGQKTFFIQQPGGTLFVSLQHDSTGIHATVDGVVHLVAQGEAFFSALL